MNEMYQYAGTILMVHAYIPMKIVGLSKLKTLIENENNENKNIEYENIDKEVIQKLYK